MDDRDKRLLLLECAKKSNRKMANVVRGFDEAMLSVHPETINAAKIALMQEYMRRAHRWMKRTADLMDRAIDDLAAYIVILEQRPADPPRSIGAPWILIWFAIAFGFMLGAILL